MRVDELKGRWPTKEDALAYTPPCLTYTNGDEPARLKAIRRAAWEQSVGNWVYNPAHPEWGVGVVLGGGEQYPAIAVFDNERSCSLSEVEYVYG